MTNANVLNLDKTIEELNHKEIKAIIEMLELTPAQAMEVFFKD